MQPGDNDDAFHLLKLKAEHYTEKGRYVVLKFDEIQLKELTEYDPSNRCLSGTITMPLHSDQQDYDGKYKSLLQTKLNYRIGLNSAPGFNSKVRVFGWGSIRI